MKKMVLVASFASMVCGHAHADAIGVYIGGQIWDNEATGVFGDRSDQIDFNLTDKQQGSFFIAAEHPVPFIPNARISKTTLQTQGSTNLTREISFGNETFNLGSVVTSEFDVSYMDYTLYYELFDNGLFSFDFGLTGRDLSGDVSVSTKVNTAPSGEAPIYSTVTGKLSPSGIVPMLYASAAVGLPFTGFNVFAEGNFLSVDDHTLYDYQAGVSYELVDNLVVDVNLTIGYRSVKLTLDDLDDLSSDLDFQGLFAGAVIHF